VAEADANDADAALCENALCEGDEFEDPWIIVEAVVFFMGLSAISSWV